MAQSIRWCKWISNLVFISLALNSYYKGNPSVRPTIGNLKVFPVLSTLSLVRPKLTVIQQFCKDRLKVTLLRKQKGNSQSAGFEPKTPWSKGVLSTTAQLQVLSNYTTNSSSHQMYCWNSHLQSNILEQSSSWKHTAKFHLYAIYKIVDFISARQRAASTKFKRIVCV